MREIKFRAWDWKKMIFADDFFSWLGCDYWQLNNKEWALHNHEENFDICWEYNSTLMQYIWLKDKNGKEVYEWDIFKKDNTIWDIRWNDYHMCYNMYYFYGLDDVVDSLRDFEIIWNIYENPELLELNS